MPGTRFGGRGRMSFDVSIPGARLLELLLADGAGKDAAPDVFDQMLPQRFG